MRNGSRESKFATLAEPIYNTLKDDILSGKRPAGASLRQDEIAADHGVSKIPVREALLRLEVEGFVLFRKNKGATVRELSVDETLNLMDIRIALECKALELAIPHFIQSDLSMALKILQDYTESEDTMIRSEMNRRFHYTLYEPCGNTLLLEMISDLQRRLGPIVRLLVTETSGLDRPDAEHKELLIACEKGDAKSASKMLSKHIETTKKEIAAVLRRRAS